MQTKAGITASPTLGRTIAVHCGGLRWLVVPPYQTVLFNEDGLRLTEWLRLGQAQVVKQGPHRVVYRVELPELTFYLKHNRVPDTLSWLRQLIRPGKAAAEYRLAFAVAARGVPTFEPLAVGETGQGPGASYLITRALPDTVQLNYFLDHVLPGLGRRAPRVRRWLAVALARFIARLHDQGILHNDLHCGNILIRLDDADWPHLYLIDLPEVHLRGRLNWARSKANLAMFNRWLSLRASRSDRWRFWRTYAECRDPHVWRGWCPRCDTHGRHDLPPPVLRQLARDLEEATLLSNQVFWRHREQRCLQTTRHHRRLRAAGLRGYTTTDVDAELLTQLLRDPEAPFTRPDVVVLKDSRSAKVVEFSARIGGREKRVVYKRFGVTRHLDPMLALLRPSPTLRSWVFGHSLRERGLPTARPLVYLHRCRRGLSYEGYLLMEKVEGAGDARHVLNALDALAPAQRRRRLRQRLAQLARLIRALHQRGLAHRDLKAANILLDSVADTALNAADIVGLADGNGLSTPFCFIDLVGVSRPRRLRTATRIKNLARLHTSFLSDPRLTRTDRLRFLRVYLCWGLFGKEGWKEWWRGIAAATRRKVQKNLRNGRPLG
jgi:serine/threonine protein kinase